MSAEQLHVEKNKSTVKDAAGENLKDFIPTKDTKTVDDFIKNIKTITNATEKKSETEGDTKLSDAKKADRNKEEKKEIKKGNAEVENAAIEKATISEFLKTSPDIINVIKANLSKNFEKIGITNGYADISVFEDAKKAFSDDINAFKISKNYDVTDATMVDNMKIVDKAIESLQDRIDLKNIEKTPANVNNFDKAKLATLTVLANSITQPTNLDEIAKLVTLKKTLSDKTIALENIETSALNLLLDVKNPEKDPDRNTAKQLFETDKLARNALLDKKWSKKKTDSITTDLQQLKFEKLLSLYGGQDVDTYEIKNFGDDANNKGVLSDTRDTKYDYIKVTFKTMEAKVAVPAVAAKNGNPAVPAVPEVKAKDEKKSNIFFGTSTDATYQAQAENYTGKRTGTDIVSNLKTLDPQGSYAEFKDVIDGKGTEASTFLSGLIGGGLLEDIITTHESDNDKTTKINGYYGVILDYINQTKDEGLLSKYLNTVVNGTTINVQYLGTDITNQQANFLKIQKNWTIDAASVNGKLLAKIQLQLVTNNPKTFAETFSQGLDAMVKAFGPMLLGILKMLGVNKGTLEKLFGKTRIDAMYKEEYGLSEDQINAVKDIFKNGKFETKKSESKLDTGEELETEFNAVAKTKYITLIENKDNGYYKYINVSTLKAGLATYDKTLKINDIVSITTDSTTGKQSITAILPGKEKEFKGAMTKILDDAATWNNIAAANASIQEETKEKKVGTGYNEQGLKTGEKSDAERYKITTQADIARYLTASLFSSKDLSFVMTENKLHNGVVLAKDEVTEVVDKPKEVLAFLGNEKWVDSKTGIVTTLGGEKKINEIIDTTSTTAPTTINIKTTKGVTTEATLVTLADKTKTYVPTLNAKKTDLTIKDRIQFRAGDTITLVETVKTDAEKFTENKDKLIAGEKNIITTETEKKYKTFVYEKDFIYNATATGDQKEYQDNMLIPEKNIITDSKQFPLYITEIGSTEKTTSADSMVHLANTLSMIDAGNTTKAYTSAITNLKTAGATFSMVGNTDKNTVIITSKDKGTITLSQTTTGDKTILNAEREPTTPAKV
ncbi:MAG: hypothetical protein NT085_02735 [candidate division SR1 bacterium]|nr:hypothetical protein [candidate division SR1 bacterium]